MGIRDSKRIIPLGVLVGQIELERFLSVMSVVDGGLAPKDVFAANTNITRAAAFKSVLEC